MMNCSASRIFLMTRHILPLFVVASLLSGCNDTRDLAPETADHAWHPKTSTGLVLPPDIRNPPVSAGIEPDHAMAPHSGPVLPEAIDKAVSLPQLIDLADVTIRAPVSPGNLPDRLQSMSVCHARPCCHS